MGSFAAEGAGARSGSLHDTRESSSRFPARDATVPPAARTGKAPRLASPGVPP
jgi:hypothetical protein